MAKERFSLRMQNEVRPLSLPGQKQLRHGGWRWLRTNLRYSELSLNWIQVQRSRFVLHSPTGVVILSRAQTRSSSSWIFM